MTGGSQKGQVLLCETLRLLTASFHELYQFATAGASWDWGHGTGRQMFGEQAGLAHLTGFWSIQGESQKPAGAPFCSCSASHPITPFHPCMRVRCPHLSLLPSYCVEHWPTSRPQTTTHTSPQVLICVPFPRYQLFHFIYETYSKLTSFNTSTLVGFGQ